MKVDPATRSRRDVDRMIARRHGWKIEKTVCYGHAWVAPNGFLCVEAAPDNYSTDPVASHLLWQDLRERGFTVRVTLTADKTLHGILWSDGVERVYIILGSRMTHLDLIARLWLEVSGLERSK